MDQETINILMALAAFAVFHSLSAAIGFKAILATLLGHRAYLGLYRVLYNIVSLITLLPVGFLWLAQPGDILWEVGGVAAWVFRALQGIGFIGLTVSLIQADVFRFLGLSQLEAYLNGGTLPLPAKPLVMDGVYGLVRHPLYFFSLMMLWFTPAMNAASLGLALGATVYFALGSLLEEGKLRREFGAPYDDYRRRVGWLIPFVHWPGGVREG